MSRKKKITPFRLCEGRLADDTHARLSTDLLTHRSFFRLSSGAKVLYLYLRAWAGPFVDTVKFAATMAKPFMSHTAYFRARDELIEAGFIFWANKPASSSAKDEAAIFEFSSRWHDGKPHRTEPP